MSDEVDIVVKTGEFIDQIAQEYPEADYNVVLGALLRGAALIVCQFGDSLEVFRAHATLAYEGVRRGTIESRTFGSAATASFVDATEKS